MSGQFLQASAGNDFSCGLMSDRTLACWGNGPALSAGRFTEVTAGIGHVCALADDASMACWGGLAIAEPDEPGELASQAVFSVQPSHTAPGVAIRPVEVMVMNANGVRAPSASGWVTIAIGKNGGQLGPGTLSGTATVSAVSGYAIFSNLHIDQPGTGYTLVVTWPGVPRLESAPFDVLVPSPSP